MLKGPVEEVGAVFYEDAVREEDGGGPGGCIGHLVGGNGAVGRFPGDKNLQDAIVLENQDVAEEGEESGVLTHSGGAEPDRVSRNDVEAEELSPLELRFAV